MLGERVTWPETFWETRRSWLHSDNHSAEQVAVCQGVLAAQCGVGQAQRPSSFGFHNHGHVQSHVTEHAGVYAAPAGAGIKKTSEKKHWLSRVPSQVGT